MKKLLIVDDDPRNIYALTAVLRSRSYEISSCSSALKALEVLNSDVEVDAVLMDMMMPEMDGYEAIPLIKNMEHRKLPVIAVTAQAMKGDMERCLDAGADGYISKPIDIDKLVSLLTDLT